MNRELPLVSVLVPTLNEEQDITDCLARILSQDHPHHRIEIIIVDGGSNDETRDRAEAVLADAGVLSAEILVNPRGTTPSNLNLGLSKLRGTIVCRVDARSLIPGHYVRRCVELLVSRPNLAVVGGRQVAEARPGSGPLGRGIARALRNPYVTGFARYRGGSVSGPADTVYLGAFRTEQLRAVGGWDDRFLTNQDYELNQRMRKLGAVWVDASLEVVYRPRSDLWALISQYRRFGRWKAAGWLEGDVPVAKRQVAMLVAPPLAATVSAGAMHRHPRLASAAACAAGVIAASWPAASRAERSVALIAAALAPGSWWCGVVEQTVRHALGERLLQSRVATTK